MTKIIPFKAEHLEVMDIRPHEASILATPGRGAILQNNSIAVTGVVDGRIICCGGVTPFLNGNGDIWLIPSIYVESHAKIFVPKLRDWLFKVREDLSLNRMETACIDDDMHNRWMESLGFTCEGIKKKYYMGLDYRMWGRLWE